MYFEFVKRRTKEQCITKLIESPLAVDAQLPKLSQRRRWEAVAARDGRYDGAFVYAVRSTGVYCRPSCPSRRPRREQVVFFRGPESAEREGFRPCRRCHPREVPRQTESWLITAACRLMEQNSGDPIRVASVASRLRWTLSVTANVSAVCRHYSWLLRSFYSSAPFKRTIARGE